MSINRKTVRQLATEAQMENDDALVTLWYGGFTYLENSNGIISTQELNKARRVLGLGTRKEIRSIKYWMKLFKMDKEKFIQILAELEIPINEHSSTVPKKGVARLKAEAKKRRIDFRTGRELQMDIQEKNLSKDSHWRFIGHKKELRYLTPKEVKGIHFTLVEDFINSENPIFPPGVKDEAMLESALFRPLTSIGNEKKYATVESASAALLHAITHDHAFYNGNKRTALVSTLVFLDENGFMLTCKEQEVFELMLRLADHKIALPVSSDNEMAVLTVWIAKRIRMINKTEHPMSYRKVRQILTKYNCTFDAVGTKATITRNFYDKGIFGIKVRRILTSKVYYGGDGYEIDKPTIKKIRKDLELDEEKGKIDSIDFYSSTTLDGHEFIHKYRKTLSKLAKL